jgi:hypothetical protein
MGEIDASCFVCGGDLNADEMDLRMCIGCALIDDYDKEKVPEQAEETEED